MTDPDVTEFSALLRAVGQVYGGKKTDDMAQAYFEALRDIPMATIREAKGHLVRSARFWPKPVDWRAAVQQIEARVPLSMPVRQEVILPDGSTVATYVCPTCEDTGWRPDCGCAVGDQDIRGHCPTHGGHDANGILYRQPVRACGCRSSNPLWNYQHKTRRVESERVRLDGS